MHRQDLTKNTFLGQDQKWREAGHRPRRRSTPGSRTELMWQPKGSGIGSIG